MMHAPIGLSLIASALLSISLAVPAGTLGDTPDSEAFAQGTRAINQSNWAEAASIFAGVAAHHGELADGALYWKAYAEDKLGQAKPAQQTCASLRTDYPKSRWIDDCGALEVEIRAKMGKSVEIDPNSSDDVKLLALSAMLRQDEPRALAEIQAVLNGDASEKLKKEAQFILGQHYSNVTYAQIVRIRSVEGDVRIERGEVKGKPAGAWEQAVADLPLETGFSLATGEGRAEIELEDASTLYLAPNSVLSFNDLHETAGVPYTEMALLAGAVSLHVRPYVAGERFVLRTPAADVVSRFNDKTYARVESFADAVVVTALSGAILHMPGTFDGPEGTRSWVYREGQSAVDAVETNAETAAGWADWDKWVSDRVSQRDQAMAAVMEESGLPAPIPGLAEMAGQGKFFDCAPYGTCWEPNAFAAQDEVAERQQSMNKQRDEGGSYGSPSTTPMLQLASFRIDSTRGRLMQLRTSPDPSEPVDHEFFPCSPAAVRYGATSSLFQSHPYDWALCHAGSWIRHRRHYVWCAGTKRHHIDPVRWVKSEHKTAFVPIHPYDVKGQPAINARHEVFEVGGKGELSVHPARFEPNERIAYLKEAPRSYRNAPLRPLVAMETPRMEAHLYAKQAGGKEASFKAATIPIHFDARAQSFLMAREEVHGGKTATVFAPISNRNGTLQGRADSFGGGSGFHSAPSSGAGAIHSGNSSSASGSRSGGSSGGGGSHGGGASSAASSSAGSASGGSSSTGSSHH
jgi:hypothetical protein